ncbi:15298_t:CDS:1, partial [Entrophospora sp. SA101]
SEPEDSGEDIDGDDGTDNKDNNDNLFFKKFKTCQREYNDNHAQRTEMT